MERGLRGLMEYTANKDCGDYCLFYDGDSLASDWGMRPERGLWATSQSSCA